MNSNIPGETAVKKFICRTKESMVTAPFGHVIRITPSVFSKDLAGVSSPGFLNLQTGNNFKPWGRQAFRATRGDVRGFLGFPPKSQQGLKISTTRAEGESNSSLGACTVTGL